MNRFTHSIAMLLLCACLAQGAWAQMKIIGPGFTADPNGYRSDEPEAAPQRFAAGSSIKDCAECPELVVVPAGGFTMGSSAQEQALANAAGAPAEDTAWEGPQHYVRVPSFAAGRYAVTKGEFAEFVRSSGYRTEAEQGDGCLFKDKAGDWPFVKKSSFNWRNVGFAQGDDHPVVCVSWNDAQAYIQWLSRVSGKSYRLLSEAEREYAARGGTQTAFWWGDSITTSQANYVGNSSYNGSPKGQRGLGTSMVNSFSGNPFGLHNVHGNVYEWVKDCWHDNYIGAPTDGSAWESQCTKEAKVVKNAAFGSLAYALRSASRNWDMPSDRYIYLGFRIARTLSPTLAPPVSKQAGPENAEKSGYYTVRRGDTLARIALATGQNYRDIARWSGLENPNKFEVGQVLRILPPETNDTSPPLDVAAEFMASQGVATLQTERAKELMPNANEEIPNFVWPASGRILAIFDESKNRKGIDIGGDLGAPIIAAAKGKVVYAGAGLRGYGNLIIIKHNNTFLTAYAHNQTLLVKEEELVNTGQKIATMGNSDADQIQLHFEIRRSGKPTDPMAYLPNLATATKK